MRTKDQLNADAKALAEEIRRFWEGHDGDWSGLGIIEAVFHARPDLKERAEKMDAEYRALNPKQP